MLVYDIQSTHKLQECTQRSSPTLGQLRDQAQPRFGI
jgi:hypothetical protein